MQLWHHCRNYKHRFKNNNYVHCFVLRIYHFDSMGKVKFHEIRLESEKCLTCLQTYSIQIDRVFVLLLSCCTSIINTQFIINSL